MKKFMIVAVAAAVFFCVIAPAFAQITDDDVIALRRELAAMKERVASLEKVVKMRKDVSMEAVKAAETKIAEIVASDEEKEQAEIAKTAEQASVDVLKQRSAEVAMESGDVLIKRPDYLPNYITKGLEFHGYFRSGYGINSKGGKMQAFLAPDALAKYRLGNEQETYIETIFLNRNWNPDPEGVTLETQIRVSYQTQQNQTWDTDNLVVLREMFGRMGHFMTWDPGAKVWAGQRFCRLPQLEIDDFWWYDMSGYGGGFEDINCGIGMLDVTFIGYASNDINLSTSRGRLSKENVNFKLGDINVPYGKGMAWVNGGFIKGGVWTEDPTIKYPDMGGVDVGLMHYIPGELNNNQFAVQYGCGACTSLSAGGDIPTESDQRNSWRVRITEMFNRQFTERLCAQIIGVYQYTDHGDATKASETWASFGLRPIYMITKHFGIEVEPGMDYINNPRDDYDTCLFKFTTGIRISADKIFESRPEFRLFATYARWGSGFKGNQLMGGDAFVSQQEGMNYGIQCENWW